MVPGRTVVLLAGSPNASRVRRTVMPVSHHELSALEARSYWRTIGGSGGRYPGVLTGALTGAQFLRTL